MVGLEEAAETFYDALAPLFDVMTDWDARLAAEGPFLQQLLDAAGAATVLDAACGSGGHALWLARQGYQVAGADVSLGMIALAQEKATAAGQDVPFVAADMAHLSPKVPSSSSEFRRETFDAVLCLGNSLPHLLTQADLVVALRGMAAVLRPGGLFVTQNLNYDLRWQTQPRFFAAQGGVHEGHEVLVWRFADYDADARRIAFHVALFRKANEEVARSGDRPQQAGWGVQVHTTPQRPLFLADLAAALAEAGFEKPQTYSRMALPFESFDADRSGDLVIVARKAGG
ncbi:MAG: class I SAM-dependent methyltransferase [Chloroflexi bacterium]|nr:class I SAM-dependent methyltransferase [Chloroflexota bacterium]